MNRNAHGEERRQVEKARGVTEDWLDGEDTIYRSRV
ncbi:hypothetical protein T4B_12594 [Trichinella pseudospiralis]|uniref:Uncharacterized protein n=1 Tax=Trichinella pseudospiralis TaxID=6337 RepID=A0A0V1GEJ9_TRIPS|nr:hypothetical protein T4B_12594 [Trichinella pseudospiralis]